ncbi:MAG TPA: phosphatase [Chloroflexi bacterium]|jgi:protein-tyrosine phosphatase|nr:phosphatase [Chloroflexota bacterium]
MFRRVNLTKLAPGTLYLHSMPGRCEPMDNWLQAVRDHKISHVICLAPPDDVRNESPRYADLLESNGLRCPHRLFPIPDFGVPADRGAFAARVEEAAGWLREGGRVLVHCGAGIGRTGMFAVGVLIALGLDHAHALARVEEAGSYPERDAQRDLLTWYASSRS